MNEERISRLKLAVNQFYLNKYMDQELISDKEFDELAAAYSAEFGARSWMKLVEFPADRIEEPSLPEPALSKDAVEGSFVDAINRYKEVNGIEDVTPDFPHSYLTYKYDGCAIKALYKNGKLWKIQSTPDESIGIVRTKAFYSLFPEQLEDKSIAALRGEVLVDAKVYGELARNKANGLTNSIYMDADVLNEAFVRIYKVQYTDGDDNYLRQANTLMRLEPIICQRTRPVYDEVQLKVVQGQSEDIVFSAAEMINLSDVPENTIIQEQLPTHHQFQIDGVVLYSDKGTHAFKFYFTDYAIVEIKNINWGYNWVNGSYAPVAEFDTVTINGKYISRCSLNGCNNLFENKIGIGAKVKIILANLTIPYIYQVISTSENYNFPVCDCGYELSEKDQFGNSLKCCNHHCTRRISDTLWQLEDILGVTQEQLDEKHVRRTCTKSIDEILEIPNIFAKLLNIDRFNADNRMKPGTDGVANNKAIYKAYQSDDEVLIKNRYDDCYNFSDLQWSIAERNFMVVRDAILAYVGSGGTRIVEI